MLCSNQLSYVANVARIILSLPASVNPTFQNFSKGDQPLSGGGRLAFGLEKGGGVRGEMGCEARFVTL